MTAMADEPSIEEILASLDQLLEDSGIGNDDAQSSVSAAKKKEKQPEAEDQNPDALFAETTDAGMEPSELVEQALPDEASEPEAPLDVDEQASMDESAGATSELQVNLASVADFPEAHEVDGTSSPEDDAHSTIQSINEISRPDGPGELEAAPEPAMEPAMEIMEEESNPAEPVSAMDEEAAEASNARITMDDKAVDDDPEDMPSDDRLARDNSEVEAQDSDAEIASLDSEDPDMDEAVIDEASENGALLAGEAEGSQSKPRLIHLSDAEAVPTNTPDLFSPDASVPDASAAEDSQKRSPDAATDDSDGHGVVILTADMMVEDHQNPLPFDQHPAPSSAAATIVAQEAAAGDGNEHEKRLADQALPDSMPPAWEEAISERVARRIEEVLPALVEASVKKALKKAKKRGKRKAQRD